MSSLRSTADPQIDLIKGDLPEAKIRRTADQGAVLQEQLEYLTEHTKNGLCGCSACDRFQRVQAVLLEVFTETPRIQKPSRSVRSSN